MQRAGVFADSKTFVDCAPRRAPEAILRAWQRARHVRGFDLAAFVHRHFVVPRSEHVAYVGTPGQAMAAHIDALWPVLTRQPRHHPARGSALPLPHPYVVPGGRFTELYYWDSYFTMLGLAHAGECALVHAMTDNFAYLIDTYGFVPNGTRTYYLSRSQPPVFALMVELSEGCGGAPARHYLPQLRAEHDWWMQGEHEVAPGAALRRVVRLARDVPVLNRYWDARDTPREESWREDMETARRARRPAAEVFRDLRAAAESGWDFSSRWLDEPDARHAASFGLESTRTTSILPVDLNAFLWRLEQTIARLCDAAGDGATARHYRQRARVRREAMQRLMWNERAGAWFDHDWERGRRRHLLTAASVVPLFVGLGTQAQARRLAATVRRRLLAPGGLGTTEHGSGQQWDRPNGWAPLQWMAVRGFEQAGQRRLAAEIRRRWLATVQAVYAREGRLVEKYALRELPRDQATGGGGGEYPLQDGFGWTNGVTRCWLAA